MKDKKIDKLFKENASKGHFPYNDSYWAGAEKLLDQRNASSVVGIIKESLSGLAFLLAGTSALLFLLHAQHNTTQINLQNQIPIAIEETSNSELNQSTKNESNSLVVNPTLLPNSNAKQTNQETSLTKNTKATTHTNTTTKHNHKDFSTPIAAEQNTNAMLNKGNAEPEADEQELAGLTPAINATKDNETAPETTVSEENSHEKNSLNSEANTATSALPYLENALLAEKEESFAKSKTAENKAVEKTEPEVNPILDKTEHSKLDDKEEVIPPDYTPFKTRDNFTYAVGLEYSYLFTTRFLSSSNLALEEFRTQYESSNNMTSFGISVQLGYKNWLFNSGIYQTKITDVLQYPTSLLVTVGQDNGSWTTHENWTYNVDSNWVIDSVYHGHWDTDTTWNLDYDSTYTAQWDSVQVEKEDPELAKNNGKLTLSYMEVPLWFGRSFSAQKFTFDVQAGFAVGFLTATSEKRYINARTDGLSTAGIEQYQKVLFQTMFRAGVRLKVTERIEASFYPSLRYTLNSVLKGKAVNQKYLGYGFSVGIRYGL